MRTTDRPPPAAPRPETTMVGRWLRPSALSPASARVRSARASLAPRAWLVAAIAAALAGALPLPAQAAVRVAVVSPQGEVGVVRQVSVRFDAPAVNAGDPRAAPPFKLTCNGTVPAGHGHWLDDRRWVFDLVEPLAAGQRCTLRAEGGFRPGGAALEGPAEFAFSTGAPAVVSLSPSPGAAIEEDQHFLVQLTGPVDAASVARLAWCEVEGVGERIPLRVAEGTLRDEVLRRQGRFAAAARGRRGSEAAIAERHLLLACQRLFAPEARVRLVWGPGIAGAAVPGQPALVTRERQQWQWQVRPRFMAEFSCERESAGAPCLPLRPLTLRFNSPVPRELAAAARLVPQADGAGAAAPALAPKLDDEDRRAATLSEVRFAAPLPENTRFQVTLPAELKDESGRALANAGSFPLAVATGGLPPLAKFAGAPFGIVEAPSAGRRGGEADVALLPLTLRHVQADLAGLATAGQVATKRLPPDLTDASLLAWIARVRRWHERELPAKEAGLPPSQWTETLTETQTLANGSVRTRTIKRERTVPSRELSIFVGEVDVRRAELPQLKDTQPRATEVLGVPLAERGYHVVEVGSRILGESLLAKKEPMYARTGVLVTNLAVHFKKGRSSSLVWVTTLDRGRPVPGARVAVNDCNGQPLWGGVTDEHGIARIERGFDETDDEDRCLTSDGLFVTARTAAGAGRPADLGFVFSRWVRGIEPWRFNASLASGTAPDRRAHTVFDRTLLRRGETVSMKHYVRDETERGLAYTAPEHLPDTVVITHVGSGNEATLPLAWPGSPAQPARSALSQWTIPKTAALGLYDVTLKRGERTLGAGSFRVEDFRVPLVDARLALPAVGTGGGRGMLVAPGEVEFQAQLNALAGGPMPGHALSLSAMLRDSEPRFAGHEDFSFGWSDRARDEDGAASAQEAGDPGTRTVARQLAARTDLQGAARITVPALPPLRGPAELVAELSFADPNGETQTVARRVKVWPAAVVVGLRAPGWAGHRGAARFTAVVLDTEGRPLAGRAVEVIGRAHQVLSTRKRIVGGFYAYDNQRRTLELGALCSGKTDAQGRLNCDARIEHTGEVELVASARDDAGRTSRASTEVWVTSPRGDGGDEDRLWFAQGNDDRIDVLPEKRELEPGQTARLQVRMPFQQATALVTVEREGVIDARVLTLSGREPVIELPIPEVPKAGSDAAGGASWAPNVTVGVFLQRGRLREAPWWSIFTWGWREPAEWWRAFRYEGREWRAPTGTVDLAKPSFKFGVAQLRIGSAAHRLEVKVTTPQPQYKVREKVTATVRVSFQGRPLAGADVAFAAVDEGLLALAENDSWDLLGGLFKERPWGVETATAVNEVIGRRHYGRKALPPGGGGGRNPTRELFDTLLLWRGSVPLDANGEALIEVPLNDSLTTFRLVALADAGADRFGQGHAAVRVTQDLQMLPGLAPLAREGDRFEAGFTVRNGSPRPMQVRATLVGSAVGAGPEGAAMALSFAPQTVPLAPGAAAELRWPVDVPVGTTRLDWSAGAAEEGGNAPTPARDSLKLSQAVAPTVPVRVLQATLQPLQGPVSLPVAAPADALPGRGGLQVTLQPRLAGSAGALPGLRRYFENYPYSCLEQKVSRTLALGDEAGWKTLRDEVAGYLDGEGLANYFPPAPGSAARGSDRLTAYLLSATHEAGVALPEGTRNAMLEGLAAFVEGRLERRFPSPRPDLEVRKLAALEALARHGRADARWWGSIAFTPSTWPTSALLDAWGALARSPNAPDRDTRLAEVQRLVRSRLTEGGTTLRFSTESEDDQWWWLMESADANAARLLLAALATTAAVPTAGPFAPPAWKEELPRLVNGTLARQKGGAWRTTTANLWGVLALQRFTRTFEREGVGGRSVVEMAQRAHTVDWGGSTGGQGATLLLPWPAGASPGPSATGAAGAPATTLSARHEGTGRPWLTVQSLAAVPLKAPLFAGYRVARSVTAVQRRVPEAWSRGDVMRVRLEIDAQADMSWVVVSDPLPAGAAHLGTGLGRDSAIATQGERREGAGWPAYEERAHDAWRAYYAWLPRGRHVVEYTIRLNNAGRFGLPPTRVEAMYAPESFGELPLQPLEVRP